ncbi:MAG: c-type cytochrome [Gemmataceae bacterium]|nr:c-type cytochrome [Gemmataceae bacterium]
MPRVLISCLAVAACLLASLMVSPAAAQDADPYAKQIAKASDAGQKAIARFQLADGLKASLFAAEPLLANPVAFGFDEKGRCYVVETFRLHRGVTDNRGHPKQWTDDDLAARTAADRLALYKKHLGTKFDSYGIHDDRVRLIEDSDGDGVADTATVFADGFNKPEDGLASGVLARNGNVWLTNIPHLWLLKDTKGTGKADVRKSLHQGYGVHVSFIGHDSHGLCIGPDGRLYFSIGDRGLHVKTNGRVISAPDTGSVLRCNLDGSDLEIVHTGLRNPQELAFDEYGNLFTGDNNADGGDKARWVQVVEGGDSGWRIGYQYMPGLGPWNREKMWHTAHDTQPAFLVPPLAHIASGPSGLTYNPGVMLLPDKYKNHFFLCDFRGGPTGSAIHAFALKPKGASFEVVNPTKIMQSALPTDCEFGPDGGLYFSDWIDGWDLPNRGRLYKLVDPATVNNPAVRQVKAILAEGMAKRSASDLQKLLDHDDMRVRLEAQFELVRRDSTAALVGIAKSGRSRRARIHAIWGLGQLVKPPRARWPLSFYDPEERRQPNRSALEALLAHMRDSDDEIRAQAFNAVPRMSILTWDFRNKARAAVKQGLTDKSPRVRYASAMLASRLADAELAPAVAEMLRANADRDPYLRHAGVMALTLRDGRVDSLKPAIHDVSPSVRLAALLAMRRQHLPEVARFLDDVEPRLQAEAARAIYDEPIVPALDRLAALSPKAASLSKTLPAAFAEPLLLRVVAAHRFLGRKDNASALAALAADRQAPDSIRLEALKTLAQWEQPSGRDPVVGLWRPLPDRPKADVAAALKTALPALMTGAFRVRFEAVRLAAAHGIKEVGPSLRDVVRDGSSPPAVRVDALDALHNLGDAEFETIAGLALKSDEPRLRHRARALVIPKLPRDAAVRQLAEALDSGATIEKQGSFSLLADLKASAADALLEQWLDRLLKNKVPAEVQLDLLEAAARRGTPALKQKLAAYDAGLPKTDTVLPYRAALKGGDAERGRDIFLNRTELSCVRCHKVNGTGGEVGPDLTGIGKKFPRPYLLEALVDPNRQIAKGFDTVVLNLANGQLKSGILKSEDGKEVRLMNAEGQIIVVQKDDIDERSRGKSAMPDDLIKKITRSELRDLVEYLAGL